VRRFKPLIQRQDLVADLDHDHELIAFALFDRLEMHVHTAEVLRDLRVVADGDHREVDFGNLADA